MIETIEIGEPLQLDDYAAMFDLAAHVEALRADATERVQGLRGRKVWMVNSTARGGGVAEMMPKLVGFLRALGVDVEWVVMRANQPKFFDLTKRIHNLIHGCGTPHFDADDRALWEAVSRENAEVMESRLRPEDILVIHDPQPLGMGAILKRELGLPAIFRCHIGLDEDLPQTRAAWEFLRPAAEELDYAVFSAPEYVPDFLANRCGIVHPAIDPLGFKNRDLTPHKLMGILCNSRLAVDHHPVIPLDYLDSARRLCPDGTFGAADRLMGIGFVYRPIVAQISRWDRLKGFQPLLEGFVHFKNHVATNRGASERHERRRSLVRLALVGPDPAAIADDPEGQEALGELIETYRGLTPALQEDVAIVCLPMGSREQNELMVNAIQRCASLVVQNSLREGFGLTVTEAMWKRAAVLGSRACGIRQQIRDGIDGRLIENPEDPEELATLLDQMLDDLPALAAYGDEAQRRVHREFLIFTQVRRWLEVLSELVATEVIRPSPAAGGKPAPRRRRPRRRT